MNDYNCVCCDNNFDFRDISWKVFVKSPDKKGICMKCESDPLLVSKINKKFMGIEFTLAPAPTGTRRI